jgi:Uncharacterized conserved protein
MNADMCVDLMERIVIDPNICHGAPTIRGTRIMVWMILEYLSNGESVDDVLAVYPGIVREDILACFAHASTAMKERVVPVEIEPCTLQI